MSGIFSALSGLRAGRLKLVLGGTTGLAAAIMLTVGLARLPQQQRTASAWVAHTLQVIARASALEADLSTMASEGRAFYFDRSWESQARFDVAVLKVGDDMAALRGLVADNAEQLATLDKLAPLVDARIDVLRSVMERFRADDVEGGRKIVATRQGRELMDQVLACVEGLRSEEQRLLGERDAAARAAAQHLVNGMMASAGLVAASVLLVLSVLIGRRRERAHLDALQALNAELERRVTARTNELVLSEARQRGYFDNSPIGVMVGKRDARGLVMEDLNPAAEAMYAFDRRRVIGLTCQELWPGPTGDEVERRLEDCLSTGRTTQYRANREPRGETRVFDVIVAPLLDPAGGADRVIVCARDVTTERALEQQVLDAAELQAEAAERELALFRNSTDVLVILRVEDGPEEPDVYYESLSPALERLTGLRSDEMLGMRPQDCLGPDMAGAILPRYRECIATKKTVAYTQTYAMPIGLRDFEGSVSPVIQPTTGRVIRLVGTLRDVTERNRMEAALRHGQKMEAIGRLAAGVAHDFNNILQSVVGGLELVLDEVAPGTPARQFAAIALSAAQRGSDLTHHLLSYARKQILRPRAVRLSEFLPEMQDVLARTLGPHIVVDVQVEASMPPIHADPGRLETALLNLAINGAHAMPKGGTLRLRAAAEPESRSIMLSVTDTGRGMDAQTLAQAFEPFFTTKGLDGTGLGLSMVQGFIEQSGGAIRIQSAPGQGTTVEMRLPASTQGAPPPESPPVAARAVGRILLVDDVDAVLVTTQAILESAGFAVTTARSGREAIGLLADGQTFDALVTDLAMPGMNGSELVEQVRCFQEELPALIVTGFAELRQEERPGGPASLLNKPFSRDQLLAALRTVLPEPRSSAAIGTDATRDAEASPARPAGDEAGRRAAARCSRRSSASPSHRARSPPAPL